MLQSDLSCCVWKPLFPLHCEEARQPDLAIRPVALLLPEDVKHLKHLWQVSAIAHRAGVKPGMTVSQAIGLCPTLTLCEPDPVFYDEQFARLYSHLAM